ADAQLFEPIAQNSPEGGEEAWSWGGLGKLSTVRWGTHLRDHDLTTGGVDGGSEMLLEWARAAVGKNDPSEGAKFLEPDFGVRTACAWVHHKFSMAIELDDVRDRDAAQFKETIRQKTREVYREKEALYPVMAGFYRFTTRDAAGQKR